MSQITGEMLQRMKNSYDANRALRAVELALSNASLTDAAYNDLFAAGREFSFSTEIPTMKVTNQKSSGRCWLFASLNLFREAVARKCGLESFELSQNYIAFWDKLEKINWFFECVVQTASLESDDRTVCHIMQNALGDGGQWDMMVNLVRKYYLVPKSAMAETFQSEHTHTMNSMLLMQMKEYAAELRSAVRSGADVCERRSEIMEVFYNALCMCFGRPPEKFDFEYVDKDKVYHADRGLTPKTFYDKYIGINLDEYVSVINSPTADKPFGRTFSVKYLGNVVGAAPVRYLNVEMEELKQLIIRQLQGGELVWFGSDVAKFGNRTSGIWDIESFGYDLLLNMDLELSKENALDYRDSAMNHAMVICGVNMGADGKPNRWKIQNSWGDEHGSKGYYIMGAQWFDMYTYQAVINKKYLTPAQLEALNGEDIELHPWDPMGTLAD